MNSKAPIFPHPEIPDTNFDAEILERGVRKHGWQWVRDTEGFLWGAKRRDGILHRLLQVEDKPPGFPTVEWTRQTQVAEWSCQGRSWPVSYYL
jgi:hypothetical protein